jgi:hypothetical protein
VFSAGEYGNQIASFPTALPDTLAEIRQPGHKKLSNLQQGVSRHMGVGQTPMFLGSNKQLFGNHQEIQSHDLRQL